MEDTFRVVQHGSVANKYTPWSIETPSLPIHIRTPESEIQNMLKTPKKYNLVSEETMYRFLAHLLPSLRSYTTLDKYETPLKERMPECYKSYFAEEDLHSYSIEIPRRAYDYKFKWFFTVGSKHANMKDEEIIEAVLWKAIETFQKEPLTEKKE